jgi:ABC-type nitrate/sulfonate/bicarbonate transport system ATPase subunit
MASGPGIGPDITTKRFDCVPVPLLENLHLAVAPSSVVALVGPSGVGKSTILRLLAGIDRDFVGTITIDARPPMRPRHRVSYFRTRACCPG